MDEYIKKYKKLIRKRKFLTWSYFILMGLAFLSGPIGVIICDVRNCEKGLSFFIILGFVVPVVMWTMYLIFLVADKNKKLERLNKELAGSELTADEVMQIGAELKLDLFGLAIEKRAKELGLERIPEAYFRDRILPTEKDI